MKKPSLRAVTLVLCALAVVGPAQARKSHHDKEREQTATQESNFDYYLLSLSWSPSFCATHPREHDQCGGQGYGFVLHGLWPQYLKGNGPQHCKTSDKPDEATVRKMLTVSPSRGLIAHEWQTHGACSGLDPQDYFAAAEKAFESIHLPPAIVTASKSPSLSAREVGDAFIAANPGLEKDMLAVKCDGMELSEVRICVSKDLQPQRCGTGISTQCHKGALEIPLAKGKR